MPFMFEDLIVYKKAMELAKNIFSLRREIKDRIIADQLSRAALSIPLNIAEGQGRVHPREKKQYYNTAKGSLYECLPLVQLCLDLRYFDNEKYQALYDLMNEIGRMLAGLISSVKDFNR
ncbi:MAG: four helix bundle protein [Candidatus Saganbacteria bacterium]|nr:four helix bundle protein [Candidatus Saganbacteria bacterium]